MSDPTWSVLISAMGDIGQTVEAGVATTALVLAVKYGFLDRMKEVSGARRLEQRSQLAKEAWKRVYWLNGAVDLTYKTPIPSRDRSVRDRLLDAMKPSINELIPIVADMELVFSREFTQPLEEFHKEVVRIAETLADLPLSDKETVVVEVKTMQKVRDMKEKIRLLLHPYANFEVA